MGAERQSAVREGAVAGVLGATAVAAFFFVIDLLRGNPFLVPAGLGHAVLHVIGITGVEGRFALIAAYTVFHYAAFVFTGILAALALRRAERHPSVLVGALLLLVVFEIAFFAFSSVIARVSSLGTPGFALVSIGNLIAAGIMGFYLWRAHPEAARNLNASLRGEDDLP